MFVVHLCMNEINVCKVGKVTSLFIFQDILRSFPPTEYLQYFTYFLQLYVSKAKQS